MAFTTLKTGIDGLDGILGGGIRHPDDGAAFVCISGGPGTGKTLLALEMAARAWLEGEDGQTFLYYSVEHSPESLHKKLESDFDWFRRDAQVEVLPREIPGRLCLEATTPNGRTRLVLTQARPAALQKGARGTSVDVEWILAEIGNYKMAGHVHMACVDNVGLLLTDLDYFDKRTALLETRRALLQDRIHGVFVMEDAGPRDLKVPSAEEFSTDLLIHLSFHEEPGAFKVRAIEILKARHQYYYRGAHHFSIAGKGITRDVYLGARNERGPGMHIYPSVAAQLSIARDQAGFQVPRRGEQPIDLGHPDLNAAFQNGTGPGACSSTVLLAEPGVRGTLLALRFLAAGRARGETVLMLSTREDRDAIRRICSRDAVLRAHCLSEDGQGFHPDFRVLYLHPEFISPGKFTWDMVRLVDGGHAGENGRTVQRLAFDNIFRLQDRFPLIQNQKFMVAAMLDLLRYRGVTPLFVDLVPPGSAKGRLDFDPSPYLTGFDNVLHFHVEEAGQGGPGGGLRPAFRVLKSMGNDYTTDIVRMDYRRA